MPLYINTDDHTYATLHNSCPAHCVSIDLSYYQNEISCSLSLTSQCLPSLWRRICFSLKTIANKQPTHDQEMILQPKCLQSLQQWLKDHPTKPSENPPLIQIDQNSNLNVTFLIEKDKTLFDLTLTLQNKQSYILGSIHPGNNGQLSLAYNNIFNKHYVEQWGCLTIGQQDCNTIIEWIDSLQTPQD